MGKLWELIEAHMDAQKYRPSQADVARQMKLGSPTTLSNWKKGRLDAMPSREHLWAVVDLTGASIHRVLEAALTDAGYYERGEGDDRPAATTRARGSRAPKTATSSTVVGRARDRALPRAPRE